MARARRSPAWWLACVLAVPVAIFVLVQLWFAAQIAWYRYQPPGQTAFMSQRLAELRATRPGAELRYQWVPYARISNHLKRAVVAAEDAKFLEHRGFDWDAIEKAREKNSQRQGVVAGGSTITQQLAKNLFLSPTKSYLRKGEEAIIAFMIEVLLPKQRILELYLNVIEWGNGVFGAEAAAQRYFGVPAAALGPGQSARLAAMVPSPRRFERNPYTSYLDARTATIEARMAGAGVP
jgi:monofunctional biosynthetic peptidoglycan transglycosylase